MIVVDASAIVALLDRRDRWHEPVVRWYASVSETLVTTPLIVAEVDHLVARRAGRAAVGAWRSDLRRGAVVVQWWETAAADCVDVAQIYDDQDIGLADASLVALARRVETVDIATLDERHFRVVRPLGSGEAFRLLPIDP